MRGKRVLEAWLPVVVWMLAIFAGSTDLLSSAHTSLLLRWLRPFFSEHHLETIQFVVRKCGHLSEYAVLAVLSCRALQIQNERPHYSWTWQAAFGAFLTASAYAVSDEFHQSFVPSRTASAVDVLIDMTGAMIGLLAWFWLFKIREARRGELTVPTRQSD